MERRERDPSRSRVLKELIERALEIPQGASLEIVELDTLAHSSVVRVTISGMNPGSVIVKRAGGLEADYLSRREVRFYRHFAPLLPRGLCPRCFLSEEDGSACSLILEDLGGSFRSGSSAPTDDEIRSFVRLLSELHSHGRQIQDLQGLWSEHFDNHSHRHVVGRFRSLAPVLARFPEKYATRLDDASIAVLDRLAHLDRLLETIEADTIVHGDAHFGNALYSQHEARLIDWGNTALGFGEIDLAHAIAMNLPRHRSRLIEQGVVADYANDIAERSGTDPGGAVWYRYKAGVLYAITSAISMGGAGVPFDTWWRLLTNAISTAKDLHACDILEGISPGAGDGGSK